MDQVKEFLRQAVKYRFWILVSVAALLPIIAYFATSGTLKAETATKTGEITSASTDVKNYQSGTLPNKDYQPLVEVRTKALSEDVNAAWRKLYERQAPLLTWPAEVADRFQAWGEKWPEKYDNAAISAAINDWVQVYPAYTTEVYKSFRPFNYEDGTGVVAAPSEADLLHPAQFTIENPPSYGKVWATQKKLWIQRTVLDVVDKVNANAKDWDSAIIKQVVALEVANPIAQDQRSTAKGESLEPAPEIANPAEKVDTKDASKGAAGTAASGDEIYIIKKKGGSDKFDVVPVHLSVLIDQSRIPDLLVAFQNSAFTVQVLELEMQRPASRVKKPVIGEARPTGMGAMMGMGGMMGMMGGRNSEMMGMMGGMGMNGYAEQMKGGMGGMGSYAERMKGGGMMGGDTSKPKRSGEDVSQKNLQKLMEKKKQGKGQSKEAEKKAESAGTELKIADPYFNIIEVRVYGQARFYKAPPAPEAPQSGAPSPDGTTPAPDAAQADAAKAEPAKDDAAKTEPAKGEPAKDKADAAKDEPAKGETPKAEPGKAEEPKADAPKAEDTKAEPAKGEAAKTEPPKGEPAKAETPKGEAAKDSGDATKPAAKDTASPKR